MIYRGRTEPLGVAPDARAMFVDMGNISLLPLVRLLMSGSSSPAMASTSAERPSGFICMNEGTEVAAPVTVSCTKRSGEGRLISSERGVTSTCWKIGRASCGGRGGQD